MANETVKTSSQVITEFLDALAKDKALDADTMAAVGALRKDDDLSKIKLLRKLEEARKTTLKADAESTEKAGDD